MGRYCVRDRIPRSDQVYALLAGVTGVAGSYATAGASRQFVVAPIDALVVQLTPGAIVAWFIVNVGASAHLLHLALAVALAVGIYAGLTLLGLHAARRMASGVIGTAVAAVGAWVVTAAITTAPRLAVGAAIPVALFAALGASPASSSEPAPDSDRRRVLAASATALAFVAATTGLDVLAALTRDRYDSTDGTGEPTVDVDPEVSNLLQLADDTALDVQSEDFPALVSPIGQFYETDINQFDPEYPSDEWTLQLTGDVAESVTIDFDYLTSLPVEHRFTTLRCVGESLNGHKLDNAVWTGTPIKPILDAADPNGDCGCAMLYARDGYFVQFPLDALEDAFLAWGMNGHPLPKQHGHPVRLLVPGHWGETNVKWLNEIELLDEELDGYWERRGWHGTGPVNTVAKLWHDTMLADGRIEVAGYAYAGTRGIETVEVSIDGGDTWAEAELSEPLPGDDVWRQWRHVFEPTGTHEVVVRAIDGTGTVQPEERSESFPSGATGWVSKSLP